MWMRVETRNDLSGIAKGSKGQVKKEAEMNDVQSRDCQIDR